MTVNEWKDGLAKGAGAYAVLAALSHGPQHGYQLSKTIRESGFGEIKGGRLYPMLMKLHERGLVDFEWETRSAGPARKIYSVTDEGLGELTDADTAWHYLHTALQRLRKG